MFWSFSSDDVIAMLNLQHEMLLEDDDNPILSYVFVVYLELKLQLVYVIVETLEFVETTRISSKIH